MVFNRHPVSEVINFLPDATFLIDREGKVMAWNSAMEAMTGVRGKNIIGKGDYEYALPFYGSRRPILIDMALGFNETMEEHYSFLEIRDNTIVAEVYAPDLKPGGAYLWGKASPLYDASGEVVGAIEAIRDITELKEAERALREHLQFLQVLIDAIPTPIFFKDAQGNYLGCNKAFAEYIGVPRERIIAKSVYEVAPAGLAGIYYEADSELLRNPGTQTYESVVSCSDGTEHDVIFNKATFLNAQGTVGGLVGTILDITERKRAEEELRKYREHLEKMVEERTAELTRANRQLREEIKERERVEEELKKSAEKIKIFAYSVLHDLKNPVIAIYGLTKRLSQDCQDHLDEKGRTYFEYILRGSEEIAHLVEKINIYISTKEVPLKKERILIKEILQIIKEEFSAQLNIRQIVWSEPEHIPDIEADKLSILRVLRNLVDNALKYGGDDLSEITIGYDISDGFHFLSVKDDGVGLRSEDPEKIFEVFRREETSREVEGSGLGLAIVKEIVEKHGGKVWVESGLEMGTTFYFSIPVNSWDPITLQSRKISAPS